MGFIRWLFTGEGEASSPKHYAVVGPQEKPRLRMVCGKGIWRCEARGIRYSAVTPSAAYLGWAGLVVTRDRCILLGRPR